MSRTPSTLSPGILAKNFSLPDSNKILFDWAGILQFSLLVIRSWQFTMKFYYGDGLQIQIDLLQQNMSQKSNMIPIMQIKGLKIGEMTATESINCGYPTSGNG